MAIISVEYLKCPFRKMSKNIDEDEYGIKMTKTKEYFEDCIEEKCMAWSKKEKTCLLMRKEETNDR